MSFANTHLSTNITASIKNWIVRIRDWSPGTQEKPDDRVILSEIVIQAVIGPRQYLVLSPASSRPFVSALSSLPSRRRRRNCRRNISASNVARLIRKVRRNIRNYGTHFSRAGRNNEEKTAQLVTTYCAINETARLLRALCMSARVYMYACVLARRAAPPTKFPIYLEIAHLACSPTPRATAIELKQYFHVHNVIYKRIKYIGLYNIRKSRS